MGGTRREGCLPSTPAADRYTYSLIMDQSAAPRLLLIRKVFPAQRKNAIKHSKKGNLRSRADLKTCGSLLRRLRGTLLGTQKKKRAIWTNTEKKTRGTFWLLGRKNNVAPTLVLRHSGGGMDVERELLISYTDLSPRHCWCSYNTTELWATNVL